jgi:hypothetical protein
MTVRIHWMGKLVTGDSGFCVVEGVTALHEKGVYGQFLIKKRRYWPKHVPGDFIDVHMVGKRLGETKSYAQEINGTRFLVHCCRDADWTTKIMSTHRVLDENQDHPTWRLVDGEWKTFNLPSHSQGITRGTSVAMPLFHWRVPGGLSGGPIVSSPSFCPWQRRPVLRRNWLIQC